MQKFLLPLLAAVLALVPSSADAACCYFSAKKGDILQPAQKVFITWDPVKQLESITVQPMFEGNALDFGMVIPTPTRPKLHEMPHDFFNQLDTFSRLKHREFPQSKLLSPKGPQLGVTTATLEQLGIIIGRPNREAMNQLLRLIRVLEQGVVGSVEYKIIEANRADALYAWLKVNKYHYAGDEATLNYYIQKKWVFTVMKIDTTKLKKEKDGSYIGEVKPMRLQFASDKLIYPLKIARISVKDTLEVQFYVQAPHKVDLRGDLSYQYQWVPMLQAASRGLAGDLPGKGTNWLKAIEKQIPPLLKRGREIGFTSPLADFGGFGPGSFGPGGGGFGGFGPGGTRGFAPGGTRDCGDDPPAQPNQPNKKVRYATTLEWARKLTPENIKMLCGDAPYSEKVPNVDVGFSEADMKDKKRAPAVIKVIQERLNKARQDRPTGYLVRYGFTEDPPQLQQLTGHLQAGLFITKFRKLFTRDEMAEDLVIVPARVGEHEDNSEHEEILPTSPP